MKKEDYNKLIEKLKHLVENYSDKPGVKKLVTLWNKMNNSDVIFILDKDVKQEIEQLYKKYSETDVLLLFDEDINQDTLDWLKENFDDTAQLISESLSMNLEKARDILQNTIDDCEFDLSGEKESETLKITISSGKKFIGNNQEVDCKQTAQNAEETLLSRVFSLIENYNKVLSGLSVYNKNNSEKDDNLLSVLQENKPETGEVILKISFKKKGAGAHLSELLIESFGEENGFELCSGCDFLTVIVREDGLQF